jgi:hypothetical protein
MNGHEYVARQRKKPESTSTKQDNCFTMIADAADLAQVADTLSRNEIAGRLLQVCERWIYTICLLCFALDLEEQQRTTFHYQYSVFQIGTDASTVEARTDAAGKRLDPGCRRHLPFAAGKEVRERRG